MSGQRLRTVVADTSALVSLAVPRADAAVGPDVPDPFQYLLPDRGVRQPLPARRSGDRRIVAASVCRLLESANLNNAGTSSVSNVENSSSEPISAR
jgi:hypothetical protein